VSSTSVEMHVSGSARQGPRSLPERVAAGKAARREFPRTTHAAFDAGVDQRDPVALLEEQSAARVPELVPIRYGRMLVSPFTFFRGAAYIMATDLARLPRTSLWAQLSGNAHLSNFDVLRRARSRLVFSVNDFDETLPGPFESAGLISREDRATSTCASCGVRRARR
jgi:hypothetical protein